MKRVVPPRLHVLLAREKPLGLVIRRGPRNQTRLILWDTSNDRFIPGQWLKSRVYEHRCDLSPDGSMFIYFTLDGRWDGPTRGTYTALSRPPYFTAIGLWPLGDTWYGGGLFIDNKSVWIDGGPEAPLIMPAGISITSVWPFVEQGDAKRTCVYTERLRRDGWKRVGPQLSAPMRKRTKAPEIWEKTGRCSGLPCRILKVMPYKIPKNRASE